MNACNQLNPLASTWLPVAGVIVITLQTATAPRTQAPGRPPSLAITHVTVFDSASGSSRGDMTVVVSGNRVVEVGSSTSVKVPESTFTIDGRGKFLLPGLWDMHVHVFNNGEQNGTDISDYFFPLLVANGIVGVRDMGTDPDDIVEAGRWNQNIDAGRLVGPRVLVTSRIVDGVSPTWSNSLIVRTAEEGRTAVQSLKTSGAKLIKVYWSLSRDAYFAIADEALKQGIPFGGHVPRVVEPGEAADAGQRTIEHMDGIYAACAERETFAAVTPAAAVIASNAYDSSRCEALADRLQRNGTWLVPTAVTFWDATSVDRSSRLRFAPSLRDAARTPPPALVQTVNRTMRRVGRVLAGTDISIRRRALVPGFSLHDELALLVDLGFTPAQALQAATVNPAKYAGALDEFGTIEKNRRADLLLVDGDPLADIRDVSKIRAVVLNGHLLDRAELDKLLDKAEIAAKNVPSLAILSLVIRGGDTNSPFWGSWDTDFPAGQAIELDLSLAGATVGGTIKAGSAIVQVFDGTVNGNEMSFKFTDPGNNRVITIAGRINGDEIAFTRTVEVRPGRGPGGSGFFGARGSDSFTGRRTR
jgi:imidazolonepropionase-like amidohydrolase